MLLLWRTFEHTLRLIEGWMDGRMDGRMEKEEKNRLEIER